MARKNKSGLKKRSTNKALNAFEIAERAESRNRNEASDSEDELPVRDGVVDARKFLGDNADYDSEAELEDEEIDSDEALGSEDEYDVLNSKFSQTIRDKEKKKKIKLKKGRTSDSSSSDDNSEEEGYSSIDESEFVPLSVAFDLNGESSEKPSRNKGQRDVVLDDEHDESQSEESSSDEDMSDSDSEEEIFQDAESDNADVDLKSTLSYLSSKKKGKEKRTLINETAEENEHSVPTYGEKLSLKDMISAVDSNIARDAILIDTDKDSKALAAPPPKRVQERNERKAAYEIAKEEVSKWENTVQQNRQAEVLKFPLNPEHKADDSALTFKNIDKPSTDLEKKVQNILTTSSLADENKEATFEEIAVAKLSPSEMKKRTAELRLMRELMFREEARAKRIKKIKSKAFRRIKKKERLKNQQLVEGSDFESDNEEHDLKRARERMNLKHKTHSNWAKSMIKSGISKDASSREELEEMLRKGEALRSKQLGYNEGEQSDNSASDIEQEYQNDKNNAEHEEEVRSSLGKGLMSMDFMKAAEERQKQQNINDLSEIANMDDLEGEETHTSIHSSANQGRRVYTPSSSSLKSAMSKVDQQISKEKSDDNAKSLENKMSKQFSSKENAKSSKEKKSKKNVQSTQDKLENTDDTSVNPWLSGDIDLTHRSNKVVNVNKDSSDLSKAAHRISKKSQKGSGLKSLHGILINSNEYLDMNAAESINDEDGESNTFTQKDLVKEAFAGDDVVSEFQAEKRSVALEEGDKEVDLTLPGWGDWAGVNKKPKKRKIVKKIDGVVQSDKRRDNNLKNVIINEKVNKKNLKYQSSGVPYPFESREQYERTLRMPIGQEWTSRETHQKLTMPRVIVKQGTVIDPLKAPFK